MSRPDSRLLVPVSALPFVSEGAQVWGGVVGSSWIVVGRAHDDMLLCDTEPDGSSRDVRRFGRSPTMLVDASAPELRDDLPVRLDALPWLLKVLHPDALWVDKPYADTDAWLLRKTDGYGARWISRDVIDWLSGSPIFLPALDVSGLTPDEAARAVVVAAVVARGAK